MKSVSVSAPGKIHLMGEHAVVYGRPALLAAVNLRLTVSLNSRPGLDAIGYKILSSEPDRYITQAIHIIRKEIGETGNERMRVTIDSDIPVGFHLGSSAALAVGLTGALMQSWTGTFNRQTINDIAYKVEKIAHGNPSGGDNTTVTYGGFVRYQKKSETEKVFEKLSFALPKNLDHFYLIDTGRPKEHTGEMIAMVRDRHEKDYKKYTELFNINEKQVERILDALKINNEEMLINAIQKGEQTLEDMGVVSEKVKPLIREIEHAGGAGKILGGGGVTDGVGFLLCYHTDKKKIEEIISKFHYSAQSVTLGGEGARLE